MEPPARRRSLVFASRPRDLAAEIEFLAGFDALGETLGFRAGKRWILLLQLAQFCHGLLPGSQDERAEICFKERTM